MAVALSPSLLGRRRYDSDAFASPGYAALLLPLSQRLSGGPLLLPWAAAFLFAQRALKGAMLSYQHIYHAGNLADLHKHAILARVIAYMTAKDKPLSYLETHAGRGLYDLNAAEAVKTGEAAAGITRVLSQGWLPPTHPLGRAIAAVRARCGDGAYAGSPLIAAHLLRPGDPMDLAELHPTEHAALEQAMAGRARIHLRDGFEMAKALTPPTPRRGLMLIDPSYEIKSDYATLPRFIAQITRKWNVGVILLWYPILTDQRHAAMANAITQAHPQALRHELRFPPARKGHGMIGSGMIIINPPFGIAEETAALDRMFARL